MKNVFIILLVMGFLLPSVVRAIMIAPYVNLTLNITLSTGSDDTLTFNFSGYNPSRFFNQNKAVTTVSQHGQIVYNAPAGLGASYFIEMQDTNGWSWDLDSTSCVGTDPAFYFYKMEPSLGFLTSPYNNVTCDLNVTKKVSKTPILIIPGVTGSDLLLGNETIWLNLDRMAGDFGDDFMDVLSFKADLSSDNQSIKVGGVIRGRKIIFDYTLGLLTTLTAQGYTEGTDLFTFPYDWRYGVSGKEPDGTTNIDHLKGQIEYILNQTEAGRNAGKVNVIAHSTGGLLVKKYVMDNPTSHHIDKAVFVGVPNTGAPKAIKVLTVGDGFKIPWLADGEMKKLSKNLPVVYDLAPSQTYFDKKGSFYHITHSSFFHPLNDTNQELNFEDSWAHLNALGLINTTALDNAQQIHSSEFDNYDLRTAGVDIYNLVGCKEGSIVQINEEQHEDILKRNIINYKKPIYAPGDGTVPLESATNVPVDQGKKYYALNADHSSMMSQDGIKEQITNILTGSSLPVGSVITQDIAQCKLNGKAYAIYSPINFQVTDNQGNSLGIAEDGSTYNSIPNASLDVFGDHKFMYLPEEGDFNIQLKGTATGTFTFISQDINDSQSAEARVFSNLPVTTKLVATVQEQPGGNTNLLLDTNGDGSVDKAVTPSAILNAEQAQDVLAPVSTSTLTGLMGEPGFYRSSVKLTLFAEDSQDQNNPEAASGVLGISYSLNGQATTTTTTYPTSLTVTAEGLHTLTFFATDKAGNNEEPKTLEFVIDATAPELIMQFSPKDQDLVFTATDTLATVLTSTPTTKQLKYKHPKISDKNDTIPATDSAGNVTVLTFQGKDRKRNLSADIKSLTYNGIAANLSKAQLHFDWLFDKKGNVLLLTQQVKSNKDFDILGFYALGKTTLVGKDQTGKIKKTLSGLILLKVSTQKGDLVWGY